MKKWSIWFGLSVLFILIAGLFAGIYVEEPPHNPEYKSYLLNGEAGYVRIYDAPGGEQLRRMVNGQSVKALTRYRSHWGKVWIQIECAVTGWVREEELVHLYDGESFRREYESRWQSEEFTLDLLAYEEPVRLYAYPGSGLVTYALSPDGRGNLSTEIDGYQVFEDENGLKWGLVRDEYFATTGTTSAYYQLEGWVCLSQPTNPDLAKVERGEEVNLIPPVDTLPEE